MVRSVNVTLVFNGDGSFDYNAMGDELYTKCEAIGEELRTAAHLATVARETLESRIETAVATVYSVHPSASRTRDTIVYCALRAMNASDDESSRLAKAVKEWLAARCDKDGADTGLPFVSNRRGGIIRRASLTANATVSEASDQAAE